MYMVYCYDIINDTIFVVVTRFSSPLPICRLPERVHTFVPFIAKCFSPLIRADNKNIHQKFSHIQSFKSHPVHTRKNDTSSPAPLPALSWTNYMIKMLHTVPEDDAVFHEFSIVIFRSLCRCCRAKDYTRNFSMWCLVCCGFVFVCLRTMIKNIPSMSLIYVIAFIYLSRVLPVWMSCTTGCRILRQKG